MRYSDLYVRATGATFGSEMTVETAIAEGRYDRRLAAESRQLAVRIADADQGAPDLAAAAGRQALARSGHKPADIGLLLHVVTMHSGLDCWNSASYIQREVGIIGSHCRIAEVRNLCDGALAALDLACSYLVTHPEQPAALLTAADCYPDPGIDRWRADSAAVYGDGGSALVLSREPGFARLVSLSNVTDPELEGLERGHESFGPFRHTAGNPVDMRRRASEFLATMSMDEVTWRSVTGSGAAIDQALADAGVTLSDVDHVVLPFASDEWLEREFFKPLALDRARTTWDFGRRIGHIGAADIFAGLDHLVSSGQLAVGQRVMIIGAGAGASWTAAILQIVDEA